MLNDTTYENDLFKYIFPLGGLLIKQDQNTYYPKTCY